MHWPEISLRDIAELTNVLSNNYINSCLTRNNYSGFVYFDIGGVLIDLDWDVFFMELELLLPETKRENWQNIVYFLKKEGILKKWCTGRVGAYDYARFFLKQFHEHCHLSETELPISINNFIKIDSMIVGAARPKVIELAKKLRNMNFGIGILSNATPWHEVAIEKRISAHDLFDVCVYSQNVGYEKPEQEIYEIAQQEAQIFIKNKFNAKLEAKDIYFIDDTPVNVREARKMGWNASLVNLLKEDLLNLVHANNIEDEKIRALSQKREHLLFGHSAALRVENLFGKILND